jgi:7,8-dihydropterin-6-yl-methyl-4-(beta-D-ribofuranosyl)aminobenzene 5'-phosphate synthase
MSDLEPVDRVEICVLIDNVTDSLSSTPAFVTREWSVLQKNGLRVISGEALCCANHGLSLVISTYGPKGSHTVLFDGGPVDFAVERNGLRLGVDFGGVEAIVLSHGHWDHAGGIPKALSFVCQGNGGLPVPLYLHPGMFQQRGTRQGDGPVLPMQRVLNPEEWSLLGANPIVTEQAQLCLDNSFFISGEIPRITDYEKGFPGHVCRNEVTEVWEMDELLIDERFIAVHVKGKGLVVFSACSHAGIVNVLHEVVEAFPGIPLHAVMGGFHLAGMNERVIPETVRDLGQFGAHYIIPAHCTGWRAVNALVSEFGESVVLPCSVGMRFRL